jgi:7,8-dihydropterin-6-yl-methyl-4-(beta-D-ribofuranosyl)aminobenzene 5'-phosphate synthase
VVDGEALAENAERLNVDWPKVDLIVISHNHWDHVGGLGTFLEEKPDLPVYLLNAFDYDLVRKVEAAGGRVVSVKGPMEVCRDVVLTGEMGTSLKEQSLIVKTSLGPVVVTGCSHQGIVNILDKTEELIGEDIHLVFGGYHLMSKSDDETRAIIRAFKDRGVRKCGATHCTGDRQIALFREAYGDDYVSIGTGRILHISKDGMRLDESR